MQLPDARGSGAVEARFAGREPEPRLPSTEALFVSCSIEVFPVYPYLITIRYLKGLRVLIVYEL